MKTLGKGAWIRAVVGCAAALVLLGAAEAHAQEASISVDEAKFLRADDATKTLTAKLTVAGITGNTIISVDLPDRDCIPSSEPVMRPGVARDVTFEFPADCNVTDNVLVEFVATPLDQDDDTTAAESVTVLLSDAPAESVDFSPLVWYPVAAIFAAAVLWFAVPEKESWGVPDVKALGRVLPGLTKAWKIGDSWASNVTVAAALFTGVFGTTEVLKSILGKDHETQVAVAVVAAAVTTGLIGAAPMILDYLRKTQDPSAEQDRTLTQPKIPDTNSPQETPVQEPPHGYTVGGLLAASWLVLTANLGIVSTMAWTLRNSESIPEWLLLAAVLVPSALIIGYAVRSTLRTLRDGAGGSQVNQVEKKRKGNGRKRTRTVRPAVRLRRLASPSTAAMP